MADSNIYLATTDNEHYLINPIDWTDKTGYGVKDNSIPSSKIIGEVASEDTVARNRTQNIDTVRESYTHFSGTLASETLWTPTLNVVESISSDGTIPMHINADTLTPNIKQIDGDINVNSSVSLGNKYYEPLSEDNNFKVNTNGALGWYVWKRVFLDENNKPIPDSNITTATVNKCKLYLSNKQATIAEFTSNSLPTQNLPNLFENLDNYINSAGTSELGDLSYTQKARYTSCFIHESHAYENGYNTMTLSYEKPGFGDDYTIGLVELFNVEYGDENNNIRSWDTSLRVTENPELGCVQIFNFSYAEGFGNVAAGAAAHAEGKGCKTYEDFSHVEGSNNVNIGYGAHIEGWGNKNYGYGSHIEGRDNLCNVNYGHVEGWKNTVNGRTAHAEGYSTKALGPYSHAEGEGTTASINASHAEGEATTASGYYSHAEGEHTIASKNASHAEGGYTNASGGYSHAEGAYTTASGINSHAEGYNTTASGKYSHAEGGSTTASGDNSHAEGLGTTASSHYQHAQGRYNIEDTESKYAFIIGNGTSSENRSNAFTVDWNGGVKFNSDISGVDNPIHIDINENNQNQPNVLQAKGWFIQGWSLLESETRKYKLWLGKEQKQFADITNGEPTSWIKPNLGTLAKDDVLTIYNDRHWLNKLIVEAVNSDGTIQVKDISTPYDGSTALPPSGNTNFLNFRYGLFVSGKYSNNVVSLNTSKLNIGEAELTFNSFSLGNSNTTAGLNSVSFGRSNIVLGQHSIAVGVGNKALLFSSAAFGDRNRAGGENSFAAGIQNGVDGWYSSAFGRGNGVYGEASFATGMGNQIGSNYQTVIGKYNKSDWDNNYAFIIGNGTADEASNRSNALTVDWSGNLKTSGNGSFYESMTITNRSTGDQLSIWNNGLHINNGTSGEGFKIFQANLQPFEFQTTGDIFTFKPSYSEFSHRYFSITATSSNFYGVRLDSYSLDLASEEYIKLSTGSHNSLSLDAQSLKISTEGHDNIIINKDGNAIPGTINIQFQVDTTNGNKVTPIFTFTGV